MEFVEVTTEPVEFCALVVHEVAREENRVTMLGVDEVHHLSGICFVSITQSSNVHIGELGDAIAVKLFGQVGEVECLLVDDIVVSSDEIAKRDQRKGKEGKCHSDDAEDTHKDAVIAFIVLFPACDHPIDSLSNAVQHHEQGFGRTKSEEHIHENADPCLMFGTHIVAGDDDSSGNGNGNQRQEPQEAQPSLFRPIADVHPIDVQVGHNQ